MRTARPPDAYDCTTSRPSWRKEWLYKEAIGTTPAGVISLTIVSPIVFGMLTHQGFAGQH
jgi:hypothetical protein